MSGIIHQIGARRWRREGAPCPRHRCEGALHVITYTESAHPPHRADDELSHVYLPTPDDHADADAALRSGPRRIGSHGPNDTDWGGLVGCTSCSYRGVLHHRDTTTGGDHEAL